MTFIETTFGNAEFFSWNKSESKPGREIVRPIVGGTNRARVEVTSGGGNALRGKPQEKRAPKQNRERVSPWSSAQFLRLLRSTTCRNRGGPQVTASRFASDSPTTLRFLAEH